MGKAIDRSIAFPLPRISLPAVSSGLLPPWYYIFELHRPNCMANAYCYLTRGQTKNGILIRVKVRPACKIAWLRCPIVTFNEGGP
jgi:hypothetical protein